MASINVGTIDLFALSRADDAWRVLVLQRATDTRCPGAWETVHGRIEPDEEPEDAALRELHEETGLTAARLYSIRIQPFFLAATRKIELSVGFAALVDERAPITLGAEHQAFEWLDAIDAEARFAWPSEQQGLRECLKLLATGDAGPLEDVLRLR